MLDFTSASYLGLEHSSLSLAGWSRLTLGKPAALEEMPGTDQLRQKLAALTGCQRVVLGASTLHLFCDLFAMLGTRNVAILIDDATYPIARWGADRAAAAGVPIRTFSSHSLAALRRDLEKLGSARPVIVTDGYVPVRGSMAPLSEYGKCAAERNGLLVVDDSQALGIFGRRTKPPCPYGTGGGGSLRFFDLYHPRVVVVSSLAKAFGAPLAMLGGSRAFVEEFASASGSAMHCSPPSAVSILAAMEALKHNCVAGDAIRSRLAERVMRFRAGLPAVLAVDSLFPVQPLWLPATIGVQAVYRTLIGCGIRTVIHRGPGDGRPQLSLVFRASHSQAEVDHAVTALTKAIQVAGHGQACKNRLLATNSPLG
jgi:8-amino-7-oxononanoate synthase